MSVYQRRQDNLWIAGWYESGKKKTRAFKDEQTARAFDADRIARSQPVSGLLTLGELTASFFRSRPDFNPHTKQNIVSMLSGDGPAAFMRDKFAEMLNRQDLERMREGYRSRGVTNNTINKAQAYIRAILSWSADQELISRNPWRDFRRLPVVRKICTTSLDDVYKIWKSAPEWLQWAIATCFALSLRPGRKELFSLLWTAFDWRRGCVVVRQGKSGALKTVFPPLQYLETAGERHVEDARDGITYVCHRNGLKVQDYRASWDAAVKRAGIPHIPMYHIRHVAASEMLARGADLAAVSAQLGHSTVSTTGTFYAHVTSGGQQRAAAMLPSFHAPE
ncbi:MAG: tyrosine-type recombinase/integrase [Desulfovibrio sp.]|nr:tyrosine-type recombinase/integrase [Desulfovibrio sp.]